MARPKEQTERRREFVEAARRAIVERGITGIRVGDVAQEAGTSNGLVRYYYPKFEDLLIDVHQDAVDRFYWSRMTAADAVDDPRAKLVALVHNGIPDLADDQISLVLYELHLHASRNRTHAALMTALFDREVSLYVTVLQSGRDLGLFTMTHPIQDVSMNAVALEDAYGLHIVGRNSGVDPQRARELVLGFLADATQTILASFVDSAATEPAQS
ncbi:MAG TPA: TetR/AcrR family transcriptional regulator [Actinomycetes bacterium]|nr:TetR/AcrR family transcriptional regulator [Actinomycetes bacterium]